MNSKAEQLRNLPAVDEILRDQTIGDMSTRFPRAQLVQWVREAIEDCRTSILASNILEGSEVKFDEHPEQLAQSIVDRVRVLGEEQNAMALQRVINATGVLLHTNLGRAPMAQRAIDRLQQATGYANVELDLGSGKRSKRGARATQLLAQLAGTDDAVVTNNCAGATMLVLQAIARDREVIISRGQLVEIGGGFRLPDVFTSAGVKLREVGTTNRTYLRDYEQAISEQTGAIIRVHRSNFALTGFVSEPAIDEMAAIQRPNSVPVIDDLGSGCFTDLSSLGLSEPTVIDSVKSGADLTLFSGDKLFGGPQCGIIVGKKRWIEKLRGNPLMRGVRVDKLTLAALEATTEIHLGDHAIQEIPVLQMMFESPEVIRKRCQHVCDCLPRIEGVDLSVVACDSQVGGGSVPGSSIPSFGVRMGGGCIEQIASGLRAGKPAIQARVAQDAIIMDLRTVRDGEIEWLLSRLRQTLQAVSGHA